LNPEKLNVGFTTPFIGFALIHAPIHANSMPTYQKAHADGKFCAKLGISVNGLVTGDPA
jgi:hypothetical protein